MILLNTTRTSATLGFPSLSQAHLSPHPPLGPQGCSRPGRGGSLPQRSGPGSAPARPQWLRGRSPESRLGTLFGKLKARGPGRVGEPRWRRGQSSVPPLGQLRPWGIWPAAEEARLLAHQGGGAGGASRAAGRGTRGRCPWRDRRGPGQGGGTHRVRWLRPPLRLFWKWRFPPA